MAKLLYLKPTGSTCYDERGIHFPRKVDMKVQSIVKILGGRDLRWMKQLPNIPPVLTFFGDALTARNVNVTFEALRVEILCREYETYD